MSTKQQVEGASPERLGSLLGRRRLPHRHAALRQRPLHDLPGVRVVVHHQHPEARQSSRVPRAAASPSHAATGASVARRGGRQPHDERRARVSRQRSPRPPCRRAPRRGAGRWRGRGRGPGSAGAGESSAWLNRSNRCGRNSGAMPTPGVASPRSRRRSPTRRASTSMQPSLGVNFTAFESRFHSTWCSRAASPMTTRPGSTCDADRDVLERRPWAAPFPRRPRRRSTASYALHVHPQLAADDARDVQHVVDQLGLGLGAAVDDLDGPASSWPRSSPPFTQEGWPTRRSR